MGQQASSEDSRKWQRRAFKLAASLFPLLFILLLMEVILRTIGDPFLPEDGYPPYPDKSAVQLNAEINRIHYTTAEKHRFGFNEVDRGPDKKPETYRIAVVGDSFVYGDGATDAVRWTRRLERATTLEFDNVEIRHWGRNGWSTIKQVKFLRGHLRSYAIDAIVVGWVTNDPDLKRIPRRDSPDLNLFFRFTGLAFVFPEATRWISGWVDNVFVTRLGFGYGNWEDRLYSDENLIGYAKVLSDLKLLIDAENIPFVIVFTPNSGADTFEEKHRKIKAILDRLDIAYVDLLEPVRAELGQEAKRSYWANPANGHPGELVTGIYAREVLALLTERCVTIGRRLQSCDFSIRADAR